VSEWAYTTEEQKRAQATLIALGVRLETGTVVESLASDKATLACAYTGRSREVEAAGVVMVTSREPRDALYHALSERIEIERVGRLQRAGDHRFSNLRGSPVRASDGSRFRFSDFPPRTRPHADEDRFGLSWPSALSAGLPSRNLRR
jgi:hypothetical protein